MKTEAEVRRYLRKTYLMKRILEAPEAPNAFGPLTATASVIADAEQHILEWMLGEKPDPPDFTDEILDDVEARLNNPTNEPDPNRLADPRTRLPTPYGFR